MPGPFADPAKFLIKLANPRAPGFSFAQAIRRMGARRAPKLVRKL
jgi:hypothetical protein